VSLLDENGSYAPADTPWRSFVQFSMANSQVPGMVVGRHLRRLGHRHIVYISPVHNPEWSRNRLEGIRGAYADSVGDYGVYGCTEDLRFPTGPRRNIGSVLRKAMKGADEESRTLRHAVLLESESIAGRLRAMEFSRRFEPLFVRAMAEGRATAWVTATDQVALAAVEYLRARKVSVPGDVSVLGYDDGLTAYYHKITSYNFNAPAVMQDMLGHILQPERRVRRTLHDETLEIEGFVSERETVRPNA
jgi:DNA-binding LacI/PurR family transcriptional regulator